MYVTRGTSRRPETAVAPNPSIGLLYAPFKRAALTYPFGQRPCSTRHIHMVVNACVSHQITEIGKGLVAHATVVRLFAHANPCVSRQVTGLKKRLVANVTFVRFLAGVNSCVSRRNTPRNAKVLSHT